MTPERWKEIDEILKGVLDRTPEDRSAFLDRACSNDEMLRREVESLLACQAQAEGFIEQPALEAASRAETQDAAGASLVGRTVGHYRILALLGAGGMGEVYRARDNKLGRIVALKILPSEVADNEERMRRFVREAKAASALNHPNVAHIYEIGEAEGTSFIAMEHVEGQTLAARIDVRPLEVAEVIELGMQMADALAEAHAEGITHRDIKPANIMITPRGQVKVLDFGLAKVNAPREQKIDSNLHTQEKTAPGVLMGTVPYMSPEQALGRAVDHRSDIFSLGAVLYEMATARRPFRGMSASETLDLIVHDQLKSIRHFNHNAPIQLERIIGRCLEKDRERRYQSARDLVADLRNLKLDLEQPSSRHLLAISAVVMLAVALFGYGLFFRGERAGFSPEIKSLAVLPLENLSGDPAQEYFADGMTEALISNLTQIRALNRVISRTSMMRYKGSSKSLPEIAAELNVDAVIEGTVQRSDGHLRVTAKLIPAATDSPVWAREYNRDLSDVLKLQSELARAVADEIRIQVTPEEQARLAAARNINPQAHEAYLLGLHHSRTNEEDLRQAVGYFEQAIQLAPDYAAAHAGLSRAWERRGIFGAKNLKEVVSLSRDAAVKAVALDPQLAEAHIALGFVKTHDWDWAGAERDITRALELDPNSAEAHRAYADVLMQLEHHDEAIREIQRAEELDPFSSYIQSRYGRVLYRARKYEEAVPHLKRAIELDPNPGNSMPYWILGELYAEMGRYDEAIDSFKQAQSQGGRSLSLTAEIAGAYARMGKHNEARRMLAELKATTDPARFSDTSVAHAYAALGDKEQAIKVLFSLVKERNNLATTIKSDPPFASLHSHPRWKELLRLMNFPQE